MGTSGRRRARALSLVACVLLVACVAEVGGSREGPTAPAAASSTPITPAGSSAAEATQAPDAAPPELAGRWRRNVQGETVILTLDGTGYHIQRGPESGSGSISVDGDEIEFHNSNRCDMAATYTWAIEEGRLRFTEVTDDPCGRAEVLQRGTFGALDQ